VYIRQKLSEAARTSRVARCNLLLCSLKNKASGRIRFFSNEKRVIMPYFFKFEAFVGMDSATLQRACERFRPRIEAFKLMGNISNNCALQESPKCHVKGFFIIFNFSLKTFCLKKLFDLSGFWWRTLYTSSCTNFCQRNTKYFLSYYSILTLHYSRLIFLT
ncbi:hypothetical protein ALC53_11606, partial [Atta colombica]